MSAGERLRAMLAEKRREVEELEDTLRELEGADSAPLITKLPEFLSEEGETEWLIGGQVPVGGMGFMTADPGIGKTTLLTQIGLSLAAGRDVFGHRVIGRKRVLYLAAEGARAAIRARVRTAMRSLSLSVEDMGWFIQHEEVRSMRIGSNAFATMLAQTKPDLVILDTLKFFWRGDENSADSWNALVALPLKELSIEHGCTFWLVHHHRKQNGEDQGGAMKGRGTVAMFGDADFWWRLERPQGTDAGRHLECDKNKYGLPFGPKTLVFDAPGAVLTEV